METKVDIDKIEEVPRDILHKTVAKIISDNNLQYENQSTKKVVPVDSFYTKVGKRILDICIASIGIIITIPINIILFFMTIIIMGTPVFYYDQRVGKDGRIFRLFKFRNMTNERDQNGDLLPPHQRITKWGKIVRKTSLDELLNLWFVFRGDMSIIGPRPLQPVYMDRYSERHKMRNIVRPGLECPMINKITHNPTWYEQFENDIYYIEHLSLRLDIRQSISLIKMVFDKKIRKRSAYGVRGGFMGYTRSGESINAKSIPEKYVVEAIKMINQNNR